MKRIHLVKFILIILAIYLLQGLQTLNADIGTSTVLNPPIDDSSIISKTQTAIDTNPALTGESITVTSNHGLVTLEGTVTDASQINTAIETAKETAGISGVKSDLTVKP